MNKKIVKSGIIAHRVRQFIQRNITRLHNTIPNTIMSAKSRNYRLHPLFIYRPSDAIFVHVTLKLALWSYAETVKVFSVPIAVEVDTYPMSSSSSCWVRLDNDRRRACVDTG